MAARVRGAGWVGGDPPIVAPRLPGRRIPTDSAKALGTSFLVFEWSGQPGGLTVGAGAVCGAAGRACLRPTKQRSRGLIGWGVLLAGLFFGSSCGARLLGRVDGG